MTATPRPLAEMRKHPRHPVELRVKLRLPGGDVDAHTGTVGRGGFSVRLNREVPVGLRVSFLIHLPDGRPTIGTAECRTQTVGGLTGFAVDLAGSDADAWNAFIDQEEATGSLWRMIGRYTESRDADGSARDVVENREGEGLDTVDLAGGVDAIDKGHTYQLRFHTVGENGEAYRVMFEKHTSTLGVDCDLTRFLPGFAALAENAVGRVLDQEVVIRTGSHAPPQHVRVAELQRGGFAYVQQGANGTVGLVSLNVGELLLVEVDGERVFPHFDDNDLERVACDTFRIELDRPVFSPPKSAPAPVMFDAPPDLTGTEAIRRAQDTAAQTQTRSYGDREINLYPQVWARATVENTQVMGPSMRDGDRILMLCLVGPGAPRVIKLEACPDAELMRR